VQFDVFMQVLRGGSDDLLKSLYLQRDPAGYIYTSQGSSVTLVSTYPMSILIYKHVTTSRSTFFTFVFVLFTLF